ncbi:hypothetical protein MTP99_005980 [Tenebrio molitor]|nr:hypothetical protein MTP99_005980 [Tenebrio molitor]
MNTQKLAREHRKLERRITRSQTKNSSLKMNTENIPGPNMSGITLTNEQFQQPRHEMATFLHAPTASPDGQTKLYVEDKPTQV